jgi:hypothetical protein
MSRVHLAVCGSPPGAVASGAERGGYAWSVGEYTTTTAPGRKQGSCKGVAAPARRQSHPSGACTLLANSQVNADVSAAALLTAGFTQNQHLRRAQNR